jgi:hypothetical protein
VDKLDRFEIKTILFQPEFCRQHDGLCYNIPKPAPFPSNNEEVISFEESRRVAQAVASNLVPVTLNHYYCDAKASLP